MIQRQIIKKFFAGEASRSEVKMVLEWIYSNDFEKELSQVYHHYLQDVKARKDEWDEYKELRKLKLRLKTQQQRQDVDKETADSGNYKRGNGNYFWKIAASFLILFTVGFALWKIDFNAETNNPSSPEIAQIQKSTTLGQKSTIFLEDGSRVVLNSGSSITFPANFSDKTRMVELQGEAFFRVQSDSLKPFLVKSGKVITRAMGTSFNINAYSDSNCIISLVSGKVSVHQQDNNNDQVYLSPGEQVLYDKEKFNRSSFNEEEVIAWKDGILYFNHAAFNEIILRLERWYGVQISVKNQPKKTKHYSGRFNNESLENVLKGIGFINDFDFIISGKKVIITFK